MKPPLTVSVASVFLACAGLALPQAPEDALGRQDLLATVAARFASIEQCTETLSLTIEAEVVEVDGRVLEPPGRATVEWRRRAGRVLTRVSGLDLDGSRRADRAERRTRLHLPGGLVESFDADTGSFSRDQRSYLDAGDLPSDLGPGELFWSFCGSRRSSILASRQARVVRVRGAPGRRLVEIEADDREGSQRIAFGCAEEWGFLPRTCAMLVRHDGRWVELRRITIEAARRGRLGFMPEIATLEAKRPSEASDCVEAFTRTRVSYRISDFELAEVAVPGSLATAREVADQDEIFGSRSILFREPIAGRSADLDALLAPFAAVLDPAGDGRRSFVVGASAVGICAGALVGLFAAFRRRRRLFAGALVASVTAVAGLAAFRGAGPPSDEGFGGIARTATRIAGPPPPSKTLCGADCLYLAATLSGVAALDYSRLVKLVRPGAQGTTLDTLRIVAECLELGPEPVDPNAYAAPPHPLIVHVMPGHFAVVARLRDGGVAVFDPGRGAFRTEWAAVRPLLSRAALTLRGRAAS